MIATASPSARSEPEFGYACASFGTEGIRYSCAEGSADIAIASEFTLGTRVNCGSIGKLVTAYFVTKIWPDRSVRERLRMHALLSGTRGPLGDATVEGCLTHKTGLWDFRSLLPLFGVRSTFAYGASDAFELAAKQNALSIGFERQYSNTNFLLLGIAVEKETGMTLHELVGDWLGDDVGNFVSNPRVIVPARARGYEVMPSGEVLEFSSFVDGKGSTNFWANTHELAGLVERVTEGYTRRPSYGGLPLKDGAFYAAGQDGGFRAAAVADVKGRKAHVAVTNDPVLTPATLLRTHVGFDVGDGAAGVTKVSQSSTERYRRSGAQIATPVGEYVCASLGVVLSMATESNGSLVVGACGRELGRLERTSCGSFSDGHLEVLQEDGRIYLAINHAKGIPLERIAT